MQPATQDKRLIRIDTPLGKDVVLLEAFTAKESLSSLYTVHADLLAEFANSSKVTAEALISKKVCISIQLASGERHFHGIVRRLVQSGRDHEERFVRYRMEIVPTMYRLTIRTGCRIFQDMAAPAIVKSILDEHGVESRIALTKNYTKRDYCVQYRESDFDFVSRLMEEEGIFYFFEHELSRHVLVLGDAPSCHPACPIQNVARYASEGGFGEREDVILDWDVSYELRAGKHTLRDHHFQLPDKELEFTEATSIQVGENKNLEEYDYPGAYARLFQQPEQRLDEVYDEGQKYARLGMEVEEASYLTATGSSNIRTLVSGHKFTLRSHFVREYNDVDWVVVSADHAAFQSPSYVSEDVVASPYSNQITCIQEKRSFRPPFSTPKPIVQGPHTAVVTGPAGEEIFPDKFGRVKVQFFWDREGKKDEKSSCWIRVATPWAGQNWGMVHIPRIGQEVVVHFLEGDPDRPIIVGSVYNADQMPPYGLPDNKTQSGIKSRSSLGGSSSNFNEIRFEDKKGKEEVYVHAERQLTTTVEANESRSVGGSRTTTIQKDDKLTVKEGDRTAAIDKGNDKLVIAMGSRSTEIQMGNDEVTIQLGDSKTELMAGSYQVTAMKGIKLMCGASIIEMNPGMITITAPMVKINS